MPRREAYGFGLRLDAGRRSYFPGVGARILRLSARQPDRVLAGVAVLAAAAGLVIGIGESRLTLGGAGSKTTPLQITVRGTEPVRSGSYQVALEVIGSRLRTTPGVERVRRSPTSADGRSVTLTVALADDPALNARAVATLTSTLDAGQLQLSFSGGANRLPEARSEAIDDLTLLLLAAPIVALVLIGALGSRAALATVFATAATVLVAGALCIALSLLVEVSVLSLVGAACGGIPAGVLLCRLARRGAPTAVPISAAAASAVVFAALFGVGVSYLSWLALGAVLASLLAVPFSIASIGAATALWGLEPEDRGFTERRLERLAAAVGWNRPAAVAIGLLAAAALLVLGLPVLRLDPVALAAPAPPPISLSRGLIAAGAAFVALSAICLLAGRRPLAALATALSALPAAAAAAGIGVLVYQDGRLDELLDFDPFSIGVGWLAAGVVTVAAASAAQGAATLAAMRADQPGTASADRDGGYPLAAAAGIVASATAAVIALALLASSLEFMKGLGLLVATGLALDLVLVRALIAATLLRPSPPDGSPTDDG